METIRYASDFITVSAVMDSGKHAFCLLFAGEQEKKKKGVVRSGDWS